MHMDENSEAKSSPMPRIDILGSKKVIEDAIIDYCNSSKAVGASHDVFVLADLGCSSGPNTVRFVSDVIAVATEWFGQHGARPPAFQVFLNDLPDSDFNALFRYLPRRWNPMSRREEEERCFVAGVPGSFYERLFPDKSVHLFHSSFTNHFLSQVPPELGSEQPEAINKGHVYVSSSSSKAVLHMYHGQYQEDFSTFLRLRGEEMVTGGRMVLVMLSRREGSELWRCDQSYFLQLLTDILLDMARMGLVEEEKIDRFNFPFYFPSPSEVELVIKKEGSFSIKCLKVVDMEIPGIQPQTKQPDESGDDQSSNTCKDTKGFVFAKSMKAVSESLLVAQLNMGCEVIEMLFQRLAMALNEFFATNKEDYPVILLSLQKI